MEVGVLEAKNRLSELLDRAERGEQVTITRHGRPAAVLTPVTRRPSQAELDKIFERVRRRRDALPPVSAEDIKADLEDGRR